MNTIVDQFLLYCDTKNMYIHEDGIEYLKKLSLPVTTDNFDYILREYNLGFKNRCCVCNEDMGILNPRQLCGKWICLKE